MTDLCTVTYDFVTPHKVLLLVHWLSTSTLGYSKAESGIVSHLQRPSEGMSYFTRRMAISCLLELPATAKSEG